MGLGNSKSKKKLNQTVIANSNASEFINSIPESNDLSDDEEYEANKPVLKWHKANPKEGIIKIQQEAEIRDIEAIYENSCIRDADLFNLMPDHYWPGKENKLPRYFKYQGDYPERISHDTNLQRFKSSSLNDLVNSDKVFNTDACQSALCHKEISNSCPQIQMVLIKSLSKTDKSIPRKGILKNRNICRPITVTHLDIEKPKIRVKNNGKAKFFTDDSPLQSPVGMENKIQFQSSNNQILSVAEITTSHSPNLCPNNTDCNDNSGFSGYFDLSPTRIPNEPSQVLKVNIERKSFIKHNLDKRLNMRPSSMDLANRNILHDQNGFAGRQYDFEKTKIVLNEKLSIRPTVTELKKKKIIKFNDFIEVQETDNYDRTINKTWTRLTEYDKEHIRTELNKFKGKEMKIHTRSKRFTKFHDKHDD